MTSLVNLFNRQPVKCAALVRAVIYLFMAFGVHVSTEQLAAIMVVVEGFFSLFTASQVEPILNTHNQIRESQKRRMINEELDRRSDEKKD